MQLPGGYPLPITAKGTEREREEYQLSSPTHSASLQQGELRPRLEVDGRKSVAVGLNDGTGSFSTDFVIACKLRCCGAER
jgi:hypothetical protein